jgi:hypothetical protein
LEIYVSYIRLLGGAFDSVIAITGWSLAGLVATWLSGIWVAFYLTSKEDDRIPNQISGKWLWLQPVILVSGLATVLAVWTVSLYLPIGLSLGTFLLAVPAITGVFLLRRSSVRIDWAGKGTFALVGLITLAMGIWQHGPTELPMNEDVEYLIFSDLHQDVPFHVSKARMIQEWGLPPRSMLSSPTNTYGPLQHTGHAVLIAGYANLLGISHYMASTVTWIIAAMLTGWGALALISIHTGSTPLYKLIIVLGTLTWGQFALPDPAWLLDPTHASSHVTPGMWIASRSFWNISQALSIAMTLGGLLFLDLYCDLRQKEEPRLWVLGASVGLIALAGLVKPSLVIFYGPALFIWLAFSRARLVEFFVTSIVLFTGILIWFLPSYLHELPSNSAWSFTTDRQQWWAVARFLWHAFLSLFLVTFVMVGKLIANGWAGRRWQLIDLGLIAFGGSVLFAMIFHETQFVGFRLMQPNIWWGLSACIVLLVPLVGREIPELIRQRGWGRWVIAASLAIASVQLVNGLSVAFAYPVQNLRRHEKILAESLDAARRLTAVNTRFALDLSLQNLDLLPYLARPSLLPTSFGSPDYKMAHLDWQRFWITEGGEPPLDRIDAVVLHNDRTQTNLYFKNLGWRPKPLNHMYVLWLKDVNIEPD